MTILDDRPTAVPMDGLTCPSWCTDHQIDQHSGALEHQHYADERFIIDRGNQGLGSAVLVETTVSQFLGADGAPTGREPFVSINLDDDDSSSVARIEGPLSALLPMLAALMGEAVRLQAEVAR